MRYRILPFIRICLACVFALGIGLCVRGGGALKLTSLTGEHAYYLDSASSGAIVKTELTVWDFFRVRGESVVMESGDPDTIAAAFGGVRVGEERAGDTVSYYYRVAAWGGCMAIGGEAVNLHIAVGENRVVVGTPVIFGGF